MTGQSAAGAGLAICATNAALASKTFFTRPTPETQQNRGHPTTKPTLGCCAPATAQQDSDLILVCSRSRYVPGEPRLAKVVRDQETAVADWLTNL